MDAESAQEVLNKFFKRTYSQKAIFGETIIGTNYSGGFPMHFMVYGGRDNAGNIYVLQKYGETDPPSINRLIEEKLQEYKFFNEKGAK